MMTHSPTLGHTAKDRQRLFPYLISKLPPGMQTVIPPLDPAASLTHGAAAQEQSESDLQWPGTHVRVGDWN